MIFVLLVWGVDLRDFFFWIDCDDFIVKIEEVEDFVGYFLEIVVSLFDLFVFECGLLFENNIDVYVVLLWFVMLFKV